MRISDWSSDVCSSDLEKRRVGLSRLRKIGAIQVDRHARVGCQILVRLTDPANDIFFVIYLLGIDLQAGRDLAQPLDGHDSLVAELLRFKRADGEIGRASCRERVCKYV